MGCSLSRVLKIGNRDYWETLKKYSKALVIMEIETKTILRSHLTYIGMAKSNETNDVSC